MAYDTLSPYAGAYPQTKEELKAGTDLTRDVGVGSLRALTRLTAIPDLIAGGEWLGREAGGIQALSSVLPHLDRLEDSDASYLHNLYLRKMGALGDPESQKKAKKVINPLSGEYHDRVEDIIDTILPFETTERSEIIEIGAIMMTLGWGIKQIGAMIWRNRKNIPLLLDKMKNAIRKKQDPKASLQIEHKPVSEARIDKTVERATNEGLFDDLMASEEWHILEDLVETKPKTKPKTMEELSKKWDEVSQKWQQKVTEAQSKYDQELRAIIAANQTNPEKLAAKIKALDKRTKKRAAEMKKKMNKEFDHLEEQQEIFYAADRKKLKEAEESISVGEIPEEIMDDLLDKRLLKTDPKHFQGLKETQYSNYTVKMLGDESNKLHRWVEKELKKSLEEAKKAGDKALTKAEAKLKKAKNEAEMDTVMAEFKTELNKIDETKALRDKEIDHRYMEVYNDLKDALNSVEREMDLLESGALTRHSRGGLVENKVNYALNQWK